MNLHAVYIHKLTGLTFEVYSDTDGGYVSRVQELPGCMSQGETKEEALEGIEDALMVMLEVIREDDPDRYNLLIEMSDTT